MTNLHFGITSIYFIKTTMVYKWPCFQNVHVTFLTCFRNSYNQAVLFTLVASMLEILNESKRADILRTVATGGKATVKSIRTFVSIFHFKFWVQSTFCYIIWYYMFWFVNKHSSVSKLLLWMILISFKYGL